MRTIDAQTRFRKDLKRERRGQNRRYVEEELPKVIELLASDIPLPDRNQDHPLVGKSADFRDCHIRPDLILVYRKVGDDVLQLARLGTHSELGF